ncbi:hypothetical protein E1B28_002100 [Marasmius oreades]|uniref:Uncharacterized protein n=1 Tax=Marasmius oreades TaxID=181124 RepID=A0A9P7RLY3_9AGAR|nr:uncharacterized protein E1B28_002100 [Marasmius oreades]KAG7086141.1 hypothetical protein E1B28_002100 [Marasmius oreades]
MLYQYTWYAGMSTRRWSDTTHASIASSQGNPGSIGRLCLEDDRRRRSRAGGCWQSEVCEAKGRWNSSMGRIELRFDEDERMQQLLSVRGTTKSSHRSHPIHLNYA